VIERIVEACGRNRGLVLAAALLAAFSGTWAVARTPLDAVPDLSDTQVIVFTEWMGRSPTLVEDQVSYPITTTFLGAPRVKAVRGFTMFGMSFVYVLFEDGTDIYWARSRALEYLSKLQGSLPPGVAPQIGPDATGVGWVFEYALVDRSGRNDLSELRSFQDWTLRYALAAVPGVAEVASLALLGLGLAGICGAVCPDQHFLAWWSGTAIGSVLAARGGLALGALCFGAVTALVFGAGAALLGLGARREPPLRPLLPAAMLLALLAPGVALQSVDTSWAVFWSWLVGTGAGAYAGVAGGIRLRSAGSGR
jgi:hypothetical protein